MGLYEPRKELCDIALDVLLKNLHSEEEYRMIKDEEEMSKMRMRMVYDDTGGRFSYSKKKVTDTLGQ